ncbi:MAG: histidine phosphatase family protein [Anaeromyxobacter sp.]
MELLLVRHAIAEDADRPGPRADAARALTAAGRARMKEGAKGLRELVPAVSAVVSSPLRRAEETARLVAAAWRVDVQLLPALAPGRDPRALLRWLSARKNGGAPLALVGHEPSLSTLLALLVTGRRTPFLELKKGGACLLELDAAPSARKGGVARIEWVLTARALRLLSEAR